MRVVVLVYFGLKNMYQFNIVAMQCHCLLPGQDYKSIKNKCMHSKWTDTCERILNVKNITLSRRILIFHIKSW